MWPIPFVFLAPLLALAVAVLGSVLCRRKRWRDYLAVVAPLSAVLGWAVLAAFSGGLRAAGSPRGLEILVLPGLAAVLGALLRQGRWSRWSATALALFVAWWVAQAPAVGAEFWRVWAATLALCWFFAWAVRRDPGRALAAAAALWLGLLLAGSAPGWREAALVMVAAAAGVLPGGAGAAAPGTLLAALVVASDVNTGRFVRGAVGLADAACVGAAVAPFLVPTVAARLGKRAGAVGPLLSGVLAGALAAGLAWLVQRALFR